KNLADLGITAPTIDLLHQVGKATGVGDPARGAAFAQAAIVNKLDIETADRRRFTEHVCLKNAGQVPGRLTAHGRIDGKNKPPTLSRLGRRRQHTHLFQKSVDLGMRRCFHRRVAAWSGRSLPIRPILCHKTASRLALYRRLIIAALLESGYAETAAQ